MTDPLPLSAAVEVERDGTVVTIRINRPAKRNAITSGMYSALADALEAADRDGTHVVLLTGAGGCFTAGNDLQDMRANPPIGDNPPPVRFLNALAELRAVLVAAVDGAAIGVGTTVLLHCDLVYATATARFALPFVNLGLVPEAASTLLLPQLAGHRLAAELMLFGEQFDVYTARSAGIINAIAPDAAGLAELVATRVAALAAQPSQALLATKRLLHDETAGTVSTRLDLDRRVLQQLLGT